jgi:hypothetical protein
MESKGTHHNGSQQIMSLWEGMGLGLKILCSATLLPLRPQPTGSPQCTVPEAVRLGSPSSGTQCLIGLPGVHIAR